MKKVKIGDFLHRIKETVNIQDIEEYKRVTIRSKNNSYEESLNLADELLYKAKNSGRNKIIFQSGIEL